jgi:hypothetical protein
MSRVNISDAVCCISGCIRSDVVKRPRLTRSFSPCEGEG